jgi:mono/diheme cytochrome c family protein
MLDRRPQTINHRPKSKKARAFLFYFPMVFSLWSLVFSGCTQDMKDQPRYEPYEPTIFFEDGRSERPLIEGTVARGQLREDAHLYTGKVNGKNADTFPFPIDEEIIKRGQQRYNIYCIVCHDGVGTGKGMIVQRGFKAPDSFHTQRLKEAPVGYFYDVITNGFGVMSNYAEQVSVWDRWAIVAYIRALQLSQHASLNDVPSNEQALLGKKS